MGETEKRLKEDLREEKLVKETLRKEVEHLKAEIDKMRGKSKEKELIAEVEAVK